MDGATLAELVRSLSLTVHVLAAYPVAEPPPEVQPLPQAALNELVCARFCNARGAYLPGRGLFLADHLDPVGNVRDRAVLLHELVHVAQERAGAFAELPACERYYRREAQAYAVEHAYLRRFGLSGATLAGPQRWLGTPCREDDGVAPAGEAPPDHGGRTARPAARRLIHPPAIAAGRAPGSAPHRLGAAPEALDGTRAVDRAARRP